MSECMNGTYHPQEESKKKKGSNLAFEPYTNDV